MWSRNSPLLKVHLRADHDAGDGVLAAEFGDLVIDDAHHIERLARGDRVHEDEAMDAYCMLRVENSVLVLVECEWVSVGGGDARRDATYLASGVEDLTVILDALVFYALCKGILDGRVV